MDYLPPITKAKQVSLKLKQLEDIRIPVIDTCKDISEYISPRRGRFLSLGETAEQKKNKYTKIIKNTAGRSLRVLKAGMQTGLTNPARPWFRLGFEDYELTQWGPVKIWLGETRDKLLDIFAHSNFYSASHTLYGDQASFGTACLYEEEDPLSVVRFTLFNMGEYCLALDVNNRVNTVYRRFWMTADQAFKKWGEKCSEGIKNKASRPESMYDKFQFVHAIQPRKDRDVTKVDKMNMPWESVYIEYEKKDEKILGEGGYEEFPCMCPRWEVRDSDEYGDGPGMEVLPDSKELQEIEKASVAAMHKTLDPPMLAPSAMKNNFRRQPGSVNFFDINSGDKTVGPLYQIDFDIASAEAKVQEIVKDIKEGLFNDLFLMITNVEGAQPLTATEVLERREEKMTMLGPVVERNITEFLRPCVDRTFAIAWRKGLIAPPPPEIQGMEMKVEFISLLAQAQKLVGTQSIQATANFALSFHEIKPDVIDKIDLDQMVLNEQGAICVLPSYIIFENRIQKIFKIWSNFILQKGGPNDPRRKFRVRLFFYYLLFAIFLIAPLASFVSFVARIVNRKKIKDAVNIFLKTH